MAKISVIGCEGVGLTVAACMAHLGHDVTAWGADPRVNDRLVASVVPGSEPGLAELLASGVASRRLRFVRRPQEAIAEADVHFVCTGESSGDALAPGQDPFAVVVESLAETARPGSIVVIATAMPVGTGERIEASLRPNDATGEGVGVVSCVVPVRDGLAVHDFLNPERLVIGGCDPVASQRVAALFGCITHNLMFMTTRSAEVAAIITASSITAESSFIDVMTALCDSLDADVVDVVRGLGGDARTSPTECRQPSIVNDPTSVERHAEEVVDATLRQIGPVAIDDHGLRSGCVGVWGLAPGEEVSERQAALAAAIITKLIGHGFDVQVFDPSLDDTAPAWPEARTCADPFTAAAGADVLVVATDLRWFTEIDMERVGALMRRQRIVDVRSIVSVEELASSGFSFSEVGR